YLADEILSDAGFIKYEISNYGKEGYFSRHNINYWKCGDYLGFGLAAHSYFEGRRFSNTKNLADYVKKDGNPNLIEDYSEVLSKKVKMSEFMFMGLRMMEGIKIQEFQERFSEDFDEIYGNTAKDFVEKKLLERTKDGFRLTRRGIDVSNVVFEGFLL
ncbi:MAG: coproporphyrinogen III oxidase, partial [Firmicutes bacterium]|nr:coproporphyrinogen III oxidase [Bacillota bacterium]